MMDGSRIMNFMFHRAPKTSRLKNNTNEHFSVIKDQVSYDGVLSEAVTTKFCPKNIHVMGRQTTTVALISCSFYQPV